MTGGGGGGGGVTADGGKSREAARPPAACGGADSDTDSESPRQSQAFSKSAAFSSRRRGFKRSRGRVSSPLRRVRPDTMPRCRRGHTLSATAYRAPLSNITFVGRHYLRAAAYPKSYGSRTRGQVSPLRSSFSQQRRHRLRSHCRPPLLALITHPFSGLLSQRFVVMEVSDVEWCAREGVSPVREEVLQDTGAFVGAAIGCAHRSFKDGHGNGTSERARRLTVKARVDARAHGRVRDRGSERANCSTRCDAE